MTLDLAFFDLGVLRHLEPDRLSLAPLLPLDAWHAPQSQLLLLILFFLLLLLFFLLLQPFFRLRAANLTIMNS